MSFADINCAFSSSPSCYDLQPHMQHQHLESPSSLPAQLFASPTQQLNSNGCKCAGCDPGSLLVTNPNTADSTVTATTFYTDNYACELLVLLCPTGTRFNIIYKSGVVVSGEYTGPLLFYCTSCLSSQTINYFDDVFPVRLRKKIGGDQQRSFDAIETNPVYVYSKNQIQIGGCFCSTSGELFFSVCLLDVVWYSQNKTKGLTISVQDQHRQIF